MNNDIEAAGRRLIHQRNIECRSFLRADGLWDIEGRLADVKTHAARLSDGRTVEAGQTYHGLMIRVTVDDEFLIREVAVSMPDVPTSECRGAMPAYEQLVGVHLGAGFSRRVKELFGSTRGCVHLTELLLPIATTAFQTIPMARAMVAPRDAHDVKVYDRALAGLVDTCYALRASGPIASRMLKE